MLDAKLKRHSYFYLRDAEAPEEAADFVDPPELLEKLADLKAEVRACGRPVRDYPCEWKDSAFTDMETFGRMVLDDLWSGVLRDERYVSIDVWRKVLGGVDPDDDPCFTNEDVPVPADIAEKLISLAKPPPKDPLEAEREQMAAFADSRLRWFQGRTEEIDDLTAFIRDPAEDSTPRLAIVAAVPGHGKSALMAKLASELSLPQKNAEGSKEFADFAPLGGQSLFVISHFVGATETSSSSYHLVRRLIDELDASGISFPEQPPPEDQPKEDHKLDFNSLCLRLSERLGDYDGERRIVILLDALNQLDDGHDLGWLPHRLGPGVRIVVSCIDDPSSHDDSPEQKVLAALQARFPKPKFIPIGGLDAGDVRTIVEGYLLEYCKQLDARHVDAICAMPQARNPLYLLVMLAELRTLGGNHMNQVVPELIAGMAAKHPDTSSLFKWMLKRMEAAEGFGAEAVKAWCIYLAIGRAGMASRELAELLARKLGPDADATALRIERGLRRYLRRRGETLDLFHGQLRQAVLERYGSEESIREAHQDIADYFLSQADPSQDKQWQGKPQRPFREIAFHLIGAQQWDELCNYLTDFRCLDIRIRAGQVFEVVMDQRAALSALPELAEEAKLEEEQVAICARYGEAMIAYARDCAAGKHPSLPEPPDADGTAETCSTSGEDSPRADRLRAVANFTGERATLLADFPDDFLSLAANAAADGPLNDAAAALDAEGLPWLHRSPRPPTAAVRPQCLATLQGHSHCVNSVAITVDASHAVSGSDDKTLRVWDLRSGKCVTVLKGHNDDVLSVSMTPDGSRALSGSRDRTLRLWDLHSGKCVTILKGHADVVWSVSMTPDGKRALSASLDGTLRLWNLETGECLAHRKGPTRFFLSVTGTPDGRHAITGDHTGLLQLWHLNWEFEIIPCQTSLQTQADLVSCVSVTPDGKRAVSGSDDGDLMFWDMGSHECLATLRGHSGAVTCVSVTPDGKRAISGSVDNTLRLWDMESSRCLAILLGHKRREVTCVSVTPDGKRGLSGSDDNTLCLWDLHSRSCETTPTGHKRSITSLSLASDGQRILSGGGDGRVCVWDINSGKCLATLKGHTNGVNRVMVTPDGKRAISGSGDNSIRLWDLEGGQCLSVLRGHTEPILTMSFTPNGKRALSGGFDKTLRVWDLDSGRCLAVLEGHSEGAGSVCITSDGKRAISGSGDKTLRIWDLNSRRCLHILQSHAGGITSLGLTQDNKHALSGSLDKTLRLWDFASGQCLQAFHGHTGSVTSLALSPDDSRALSGSKDNTLRLWDLQSGQCLRILKGHSSRVTSVALSPDGSRAVSGSADKTLRVWDLTSGQCVAIYYAGAGVLSVAISPADDRIVCGTEDGQMHFLTMRNFPR